MHYDVVANGVLWFLHHGMFDHVRRPRFDLHFRDAWDAFVAVNQRFTDAVVRDRGRGRHRARPGLPADADRRAAARAAARPARRALHAHAVRAARRLLGPARPTSARRSCGALASGPAGFHTKRWAEGYRQSARADARPARATSRPRSPRASAPTSPRSRRSRSPRPRARPASTLADAVGDRLVIARSDRIDPSKNIVRGFLAFDRLLEARPGPARPGRVRRDGVPVAPGPRRVPRVRERGRAGRRQGQRPLGDLRLAADPARRPRRLRPFDRGPAALRRAARELDQGRAQPRRQGRTGAQPARRRAVPVARDRRVGRDAVGLDPRAPVRHRAVRGRARRRAVDAARRARGPCAPSCARLATAAHPGRLARRSRRAAG